MGEVDLSPDLLQDQWDDLRVVFGGTISNNTIPNCTISSGTIFRGTISNNTIPDCTISSGMIFEETISNNIISNCTISNAATSNETYLNTFLQLILPAGCRVRKSIERPCYRLDHLYDPYS